MKSAEVISVHTERSSPTRCYRSLLPYFVQNEIEHKVLHSLLDPLRQLYNDVRRKALMRLEYEGLHKADAITRPGGRFFEDPASFAMERYAYYVCYKCNKVSWGMITFFFLCI